MTTPELLSDLRHKGVRLWAEGNKLRYSAPTGALTANMKAELAERKGEILSLLGDISSFPLVDLSSLRAFSQDGELPLSFAEQGLWLLDQLRPGMTAYNMQSCVRLRGVLDVKALEESFTTVIQRHDVLRTRFGLVKEEPVRLVTPALTIKLPVIDVDRRLDSDAEISRTAFEDLRLPFDLAKGPLLRVRLLRLGENQHVLVLTIHHIITDAWSNRILFRELLSLYEAYSAAKPPPLPDLPMQYSDYALWQCHLKQEDMRRDLAYWRTKLREVTVSELPCDYRRPRERSFRGARQQVQLSKTLAQALKSLGKQEQATPFMILVAAFQALLHRYTGETDVVVGSTITGRNRPEFGDLIGFFINVLVLRSDLAGRPTFRDLLKRVREVCLEAYEHQDLPFEKLVQELKPKRDLNRNGFFQVLFNMANLPAIQHDVAGLTLETLSRSEETARFDLALYAPETKEGITIIAAYSSDLFSPDRILEMLEQYRYLLEQIAEDPDKKIDLYSLLTPSARTSLPDPNARLDNTWRGAVHDLIAVRARIHPEKLAIEDSEEAWTYEELNKRSNQLAQHLRNHGIEAEDVVAVYGERGAGLVWALLGILKAGAAFCVVDPQHPALRIADYLQVAGPKGLIQVGRAVEPNAEIERVLSSFPLRLRITLPSLANAQAGKFLSHDFEQAPAVQVTADDLAYVVFTSGTTGKPKGVLGRHGPLSHFLPWLTDTFGLSENDRFSCLSGVATNILQREIFTALALGGTLYIPDVDDIGGFGRLDDWMRKKEISVVHFTPAMARLLADTATGAIPFVRCVFFVGDLLRRRDIARTREFMPQAEIANLYNSSETQRGGGYKLFPRESAQEERDIPSLGRGVRDVQLLVVNATGKTAGVGELGEIWVRSPHLARGYLGDDKLSNERFIVNPFTGKQNDRIFRTGERGRYSPKGEVEYVSRGENQVSIRGFRVELGEIESVLMDHSSVKEAVVAGYDDPTQRLIAYVTPMNGATVGSSELRSYLRTKLPNHMIPTGFVVLEALPMTPAGKVDRKALPDPGTAPMEQEQTYVPPATLIEEQLARIWQDVLKIEKVGIHDNFFDLGGHSLAAIRVVSQVIQQFQLELPPQSLFQAPTVAEMGAVISTYQGERLGNEELDRILSQLESLSDEDVKQLLADQNAVQETKD